MNKINPNINSLNINPLSITKPEYKDPSIEDIYLDRGKEEYIYNKGYIQNYDVIVVKRITPDLVKKFAYPFISRIEAVDFMRSLYHRNDVIAEAKEEEVILNKDIAEPEKECTSENKEPTNRNFSFGDDDLINYRNEMQRLRDKPIPVKETNIRENKLKIGNGIF